MNELLSFANNFFKEIQTWIDFLWTWFNSTSREPAFTVTLYTLWGIYQFLMGIGRLSRYYVVMREKSALYLAISDFLQCFAFIGAALLTAPHPLYNFSFLLPWMRFSWLLALPFFIIATHLKGWFVAQMVYRHHDDTKETIHVNDPNETFLQEQDANR